MTNSIMIEADQREARPQAAGFTLIEMVMVILLLGLMTAFAAPQLRGFYEQSEMARISTGLLELLNYAHQRAVLEQQQQTVIIDVRENTYWMEMVDEERIKKRSRRGSYRSRRRQKMLEKLNGGLPRPYEFDHCYLPVQDDRVRRGEARLTFYPDGSCDGLHVTIARLDKDRPEKDRYLFIRLNSNTGKARVRESVDRRDGDRFFEGYWDEDEE